MLVADWMTKKVFTVSPDDSLSEAVQLSKEKRIKHIPVIQRRKIKGILSDRDIKEYVPALMKTLDVYQLHVSLTKTKVKDVMKTNIVHTGPETPIEEAAMIMHDKNIGCLPVLEGTKLVGIISDRDLFRVLVDISGVRHRGHRVYLPLRDRPGAINDITSITRKHGYRLQSILTSYEGVKKGYRHLVVRLKGSGNFKAMRDELEATYLGVKIKKG
jgi:acetoin utilization protein AcuB